MKKVLSLLIILASFQSHANSKELIIPFTLIYDSVDRSLNNDQALYLFDLSGLEEGLRDPELIYSVDNGENQFYDYSEGDTLAIISTPGVHTFRFYGGAQYEETRFMQLTIDKKHRQLYQIHFSRAYELMPVRKPVIYLYPEETIDVSIEVHPKGEFTFSYPPIKDGWHFSCKPNGELTNGENTYRYLFWESEQAFHSEIIDRNTGAILSGPQSVKYLEAQMQEFGMNSQERADFITYWGPILQKKSNLYIYLLFNEECDAFASLEFDPKPEKVGRFYVIWAEVPDDYSPSLEPQKVPAFQRNGFTVLEWGGSEVSSSSILFEDL